MDAQSPLTQPPEGNVGPIALSGSLDQYQAEPLQKQLLGAVAALKGKPSDLLLDMSAVEHIDASSLQVLLAFRASLSPGKVRLKGVNAAVQSWLRIAGADSLFEFVNSSD